MQTLQNDDFFDFTNADASSQKHLLYLNDSDRDIRMLDRHPEVRKLFSTTYTAIASTALEHLFSTGTGAYIANDAIAL